MPTRLLPYGPAAVEEAARHIAAGRPCAVATETVYGLAGDATDSASVAAIYAAKGRPSFNPLIVHVASTAMAADHATLNAAARALAAAFWPGPLTLVLPRRAGSSVASLATAGLDTVALRHPAHTAMQELIAAVGRPLAAPSANASGGVSPTTAAHVLATLDGRIAAVIDAGPCTAGIESTIVRPMHDCIILLRPGPITPAMLRAVCDVPVMGDDSGEVTAPGQLASHYAPGKPVLLSCTDAPGDCFIIGFGPGRCDYALSETGDLMEAAARLFDALHAGAASHHPRIAVAPIPDQGLGLAINDRLRRAAA